MNDEQPTYQITLRSLPGQQTPAVRRLGRALKKLLREYSFRCLDARQVGADGPLTLADFEQAEQLGLVCSSRSQDGEPGRAANQP